MLSLSRMMSSFIIGSQGYKQIPQIINREMAQENLKIYILKCQEGKYYVGKTFNLDRRYDQHLSGSGSAWTHKYHPINLEEVIDNADKFDEDKYVWKYMEKYGIENVRGGSYSQVVLSPESIACAKKHLGSGNDLCYACGESGHFIKDCSSQNSNQISDRKRKRDDNSEEEIRSSKTIRRSNSYSSFIRNSRCYRCGRMGHWRSECYAITDVSGRRL